MTSPFTENEITRKLTEVLEYDFRVSPAEANHTQIYKALSKIVVNYLKEKRSMFMTDCNSKGRKQVYYLSNGIPYGTFVKDKPLQPRYAGRSGKGTQEARCKD